MDNSLFNFNKELLFGEIGAILGAPLVAFIVSKFNYAPSVISGAAVAGGIIGAAIFWLSTRIWDKGKEYSIRKLTSDLAYFTPAAFLVTLIIYYPTLFFLSRSFLSNEHRLFYSVFVSQITAFLLFIGAMNIYRFFLLNISGKKL